MFLKQFKSRKGAAVYKSKKDPPRLPELNKKPPSLQEVNEEIEKIEIEDNDEEWIPGKPKSTPSPKKEENVSKQVLKCGRIRFEGIPVIVEEPLRLLCEECEKQYSVIYCSACDQVMCGKCADLTHQRSNAGMTLHPHETPDRWGKTFIRPVEKGDISRVKIEKVFSLPNYEIHEEDLAYQTDLTKPNSLTTCLKQDIQKSMQFYGNAAYNSGEILLFIDPVTSEQAFGRVISEWDFRHGSVAPSIIRGDKSGVWYIVEMIDLIANVGSLEDVIKVIQEQQPPKEYPVLEDVQDIPYRHDIIKARDYNDLVKALNKVLKYGPINHLNLPDDNRFRKNGNNTNSGQEFLEHDDENDNKNNEDSDNEDQFSLSLAKKPKHARERLYKHYVGNKDIDRCLKILVLGEAELCRVDERAKLLANAKFSFLQEFLSKRFFSIFQTMISRGFYIWKDSMESLRIWKMHKCSQKIQSIARRWLCRDVIDKKYDEWEAELYRRWHKLHERFEFCAKDTPYAVTMDNQLYFRTINGANKYSRYLRKMVMLVWNTVDRKRQKLIRLYLRIWKDAIAIFNESDLEFGHFHPHAIDIEHEGSILSPNQEQHHAKQLQRKLLEHGVDAVGSDSSEWENVLSMPLARNRVIDSDNLLENTIPWHPNLGVDVKKLPDLPLIFTPKTAEERLFVKDSRRLDYCGFRAHSEGPTDESCWVIPSRLCMGVIPWGIARKKESMSALTSILLSGVSVFVSLMEEEEELLCEKQLNFQPIEASLKGANAKASFDINEIIRNSKEFIREIQVKIQLIPTFHKRDPRYEEAYRQKVKYNAKLNKAASTIERAKNQIKLLPTTFEWIRIPIKSTDPPNVHEMMHMLYGLEHKIAEGKSIYLYSREGHGRVGLFAGCLLGRLYGLKPYDALWRIQACHDCMKCEENRKVRANCPQLGIQKRLVEEVLIHTGRVLDGVRWNAHTDPETYVEEKRYSKRGTKYGPTFGGPQFGFSGAPLIVESEKRTKSQVLFRFNAATDTPKPESFKPEGPEPDDISLSELYVKENSTELNSVVRQLPLLRSNPSESHRMPLLRTRLTQNLRDFLKF